jgi:hypothetical protein
LRHRHICAASANIFAQCILLQDFSCADAVPVSIGNGLLSSAAVAWMETGDATPARVGPVTAPRLHRPALCQTV